MNKKSLKSKLLVRSLIISLIFFSIILSAWIMFSKHVIETSFNKNLPQMNKVKILNYTDLFIYVREDLESLKNNLETEFKDTKVDVKKFDLLTERLKDDSVRSKDFSQSSFFFSKGLILTDPIKRRALISKKEVDHHFSNKKQIDGVWVVFKEGGNLFLNHKNPLVNKTVEASFSDLSEPYFQLATPEKNPKKEMLWTKPYLDPSTKKWMVSLISPLFEGTLFVGVCGIDITLNNLILNLSSTSSNFEENFILDEDQRIIAHSGILQNPDLFEKLEDIYPDFSSSLDKSFVKSSIGTFVSSSLPINGWKFVSLYKSRTFHDLRENSILFGLLFFLIFSLIYFMAYWTLSKEVLEPLNSILKYIKTRKTDCLKMPNQEFYKLMNEFLSQNLEIISKNKALKTKNLELENQLKNSFIKTIESSKKSTLNEIASGISHEINNPLTSMNGYLSLLKNDFKKMNLVESKSMDRVIKIEALSYRIANIVSSLRKYARDNSKDDYASINLEKVIQDVSDLAKIRLGKNNIDLFFQNQVNPERQLFWREGELVQILTNLIFNSSEAISRNNEMTDKWIRVEFFENDGVFKILITDSGEGVCDSVKNKMFNPFVSSDQDRAGVGLCVIRSILDKNNGSIVYNQNSKNTQFIVEIFDPTLSKKVA